MADTLPNTSDQVNRSQCVPLDDRHNASVVILVKWTWETHTDSQGQPLNHPSMWSMILIPSSISLIGSPVALVDCVTIATSHNSITPLVVLMLTV
jgi:hypothetical protein